MKEITFRSSWHQALSQLDPKDQGIAYNLIMSYAFDGVDSQLEFVPPIVQGLFLLIREELKADLERKLELSSIRKACGKKGGRPRKKQKLQNQNNQKVSLVSVSTSPTKQQKASCFPANAEREPAEGGSLSSSATESDENGKKAKGLDPFPLSSPFSLSPMTPNSIPPIIPQSRHLHFVQMTHQLLHAHEEKLSKRNRKICSTVAVSPCKELMDKEFDPILFVAYFNGKLSERESRIPALRALRGERLAQLKARIHEFGKAPVLEAIENLVSSEVLNGKNARGWRATFDWFIQPKNFTKVLENNYKELFTNSNSIDHGTTSQRTYNSRRGCNPTATSAKDYYTSF